MPQHPFDRRTYNQLRADLLHVQYDLMTEKERDAKIAHILNFVGNHIPKIASVQDSSRALSVLNQIFSINDDITKIQRKVQKIRTASFLSREEKEEELIKVALKLEKVYGHDKVALERVLKKVFEPIKQKFENFNKEKITKIKNNISSRLDTLLNDTKKIDTKKFINDPILLKMERALEKLDPQEAARVRLKVDDYANFRFIGKVINEEDIKYLDDSQDFQEEMEDLSKKDPSRHQLYTEILEAKRKAAQQEESEAGQGETIPAAGNEEPEKKQQPDGKEEVSTNSEKEKAEPPAEEDEGANDPESLRFVKLLRRGKLPSDEMFDKVRIDAHNVYYDKATISRSAMSLSIGIFLRANLENHSNIISILSNKQVGRILGVNGLANQIRYAFKGAKKNFLDVYEKIAQEQTIFNRNKARLSFSYLFQEELEDGPQAAYNYVSGINEKRHPKSFSALVDACRERYSKYNTLWNRLEPEQSAEPVEEETKPVGEAEREIPQQPLPITDKLDLGSLSNDQLKSLSSEITKELNTRVVKTKTPKTKAKV